MGSEEVTVANGDRGVSVSKFFLSPCQHSVCVCEGVGGGGGTRRVNGSLGRTLELGGKIDVEKTPWREWRLKKGAAGCAVKTGACIHLLLVLGLTS